MEGPAYVPKSGFARWLDTRLPLIRFTQQHVLWYPTPRNLNVWYVFGGILTIILVVQILTGIVLAMHYTPDSTLAFDSVEHIMRDVNSGWLLRYLHSNGASMFFIAVYIHIFRGLYYGSYKAPRELIWIIGVLIYMVMMATAFLGYTLPWGQMSFWGATVITNFFSALNALIPHLGDTIVTWLWGGFGVDNATLHRFFSLHYLLPFVLAALVALHIWALHVPGNNNPLGIDVKGPQDTVPFHPYYTVKDAFFLSCFLIVWAWLVFFDPNLLGDPINYVPANPIQTPEDITPEWYFLPFYAILRSIPSKLIGVIALFLSLFTLFFVAWLDTSSVRSARFRPVYKQFFWILVADVIILGMVGARPVDATLFNTGIPLVWVGPHRDNLLFPAFLGGDADCRNRGNAAPGTRQHRHSRACQHSGRVGSTCTHSAASCFPACSLFPAQAFWRRPLRRPERRRRVPELLPRSRRRRLRPRPNRRAEFSPVRARWKPPRLPSPAQCCPRRSRCRRPRRSLPHRPPRRCRPKAWTGRSPVPLASMIAPLCSAAFRSTRRSARPAMRCRMSRSGILPIPAVRSFRRMR